MKIRSVSLKRAKKLRLRKKLTDSMQGAPCVRCGERADDAHEILSRARGGSITDRANIVPLCRKDHDWVTTHPIEAHAEGLLLHAWETSASSPKRVD